MGPDDRIDHTLRAIAQADASREFAARVRARIEAGHAEPTAWWPRVASAAAAMLIVVAAVWWLREAPRSPQVQVAQTTAPVATAPTSAGAPTLERSIQPRDVRIRQHVSSARGAIARAGTVNTVSPDHERALAPLSALAAISLASVAPDAMVVVDHAIAPLAPIAPLSVHDMLGDANEGEL